jgi:GNAT superfamily N-acetyltransferase
MENYIIRTMTRDELDFAVELAAGEGWNPGLFDADSFYAADPEGFLIGLLDGEPISCISAVRFSDDYGFIGFYIVKPGYRGHGYGYRIWQAGMDRLAECNIGLDGVVAQVDNYRKSGFSYMYANQRYGASASHSGSDDPRMVPLADVPFEQVLAYDTPLVPAPRADFLRSWVSSPRVGLALRDGDALLGYGVVRECREGYKVGPLFAQDKAAADALLQALMRRVPEGSTVYVDVPGEAENPAATELVREHGMTPIFEAARMYRLIDANQPIRLPLQHWFGVTTLELG